MKAFALSLFVCTILTGCQAFSPTPQTVVDVASLTVADLACLGAEYELGDRDPATAAAKCHIVSGLISEVEKVFSSRTTGHNMAMAEMGAVDAGPGK